MIDDNISKILVPIDFSPASLNALDSATALARQQEAGLLLLHVLEPVGLSGVQCEGYQSGEAIVAMTHHAQQELQAVQHSVIETSQVDCEVIVARGNVSSAIIQASVDYQADIIVMGTHGAIASTSFIGLNAFNVVKKAACPVLTIPPKKKWPLFTKILFPVRPILSALEKYDFIRKIILKSHASMRVLGLAGNDDKDVTLIKQLASELNEKLKADQVEAATYFKVGQNMAEEVLKIASLMETDLIVITASLDASGSQVLVGPYMRDVINHSHFPVLCIKPSEESGFTSIAAEPRAHFPQQIPSYN